ncbi:MAG TPA: VCBS repeat-containing protein, partial [Polyangia bacterium]|nr:VCBS repeat-containing protein [Polyangia bacterium]
GSGCSNVWSAVDTIDDNSVLWHNSTSGAVSEWLFDDSGTIFSAPNYSWTCDSSCSSVWKSIGRIWQKPACSGGVCGDNAGLAWFDAGSGQVSIWQLLGTTVTGTQTVSWTCGGTCPSVWQPMLTADFNNDGNSDILWYDQSSGQLSVWLLDSNATVLGTQLLSWTCSSGSGCASAWRLVGAADVNRDGNVDLLWHNAGTGDLSNWLLDGSGNVIGAPDLSWTCDSTCASSWRALGYIQYP